MNKKQAAAEWATSHAVDEWKWSPEEKSPMMDDIMDSVREAFVSGWDAGQRQLLGEAATQKDNAIFNKLIRGWTEKHNQIFAKNDDEFLGHTALHFFKNAWQAAKLSCAAELAAKDAELEAVTRQRDEAVEVLKLYGDPARWHYSGTDSNFATKEKTLYYGTFVLKEDREFHEFSDDLERNATGGRLAREFLAKIASGEKEKV